jgi:hypothetical protein
MRASRDSLTLPEPSTVKLALMNLMWLSGKGSLAGALMLQRGDHAGLQAALGNLQVTVQAIDQVDQQLLLLQLALSHLALQGHAAARVVEGQLAITAGVDGAKCGQVGVRASLSRLQTLSIRITRFMGLEELTVRPGAKFSNAGPCSEHARAT